MSFAVLRRIELSSNSGRATLYLGSRDGSSILGPGGHQCFSLHAVGPAVKTKPTYVRVMDYYNPIVNDTQVHNCLGCFLGLGVALGTSILMNHHHHPYVSKF